MAGRVILQTELLNRCSGSFADYGDVVNQPSSVCGYEILAELGRGANSIVYKARYPFVRPDRPVALKMPVLGSESDAPLRLANHRRESFVLAMLSQEPDPALPSIYDIGYDPDPLRQHYYIAREFVEGSTLEQLISAGALGLPDRIAILAAITEAVQRVHGRGFVHRNLQPSNVLIRRDSMPKLIGFGLSATIAGWNKLPPGVSGVSPEVDVRGLKEMLGWLCATICPSVPLPLRAICQSSPGQSPGALAEALRSYLQQG
jgi:serine/threonine protein kinase